MERDGCIDACHAEAIRLELMKKEEEKKEEEKTK